MTILHIKNLCSSYEGNPLLKNINFSLEEGEILCLLGPSGSGKTTLLRLIAGLETGDEGNITFDNLNIQKIPPHKRNFGMMFQEYALFPHKNVYDNVAFGLEIQKLPENEKQRKVSKILNIVGLNGFDKRSIDDLSGGERQRVALARSLAPEPRLLLLDEPLGSLDRTLRDRLATEIRAILKELGVTALFVTHDQSEAFTVADQVAILFDGKLEQFDRPEKLYQTPKNSIVARFLGFKNIIEGEWKEDKLFHSHLGTLNIQQKPPTEKQTLLIRPEGARMEQSENTRENEFLLSGKIISRQFQGATYKLQVEVGNQNLFFALDTDPAPPEINANIRLAISPSSIVWMSS